MHALVHLSFCCFCLLQKLLLVLINLFRAHVRDREGFELRVQASLVILSLRAHLMNLLIFSEPRMLQGLLQGRALSSIPLKQLFADMNCFF